MTTRWNLSNKNIRKEKSGRPEGYYQIIENTDTYLETIFTKLDLKVTQVERLGGQSSVNFLLHTTKGKFILKIDPWVGVLETADRFFSLVGKHLPHAPTPSVFAFDVSKTVIPYEYIVINYIEHIEPKKLEQFNEFEAGVELGKLLKEIHQIKVDGFGVPKNQTDWQYQTWKDTVFDSLNSHYTKSLTEVLPDYYVEKVKELAENIKEISPVLLHADLSLENTLYRVEGGKLKLVGLIDPNTMGGDFRWDISLCLRDESNFDKGILTGYFGKIYEKCIDDETNILLLINLLWIMGWQHLYAEHINEGNKLKFERLLSQYQ